MKPRCMAIFAMSLTVTGCSRSNNLLMGRVEAQVGGHRVVVTDCYRISVPEPQQVETTGHWQPCRDADIQIRAGGKLIVNGKPYGNLGATDGVLIDHGAVSIQRAN